MKKNCAKTRDVLNRYKKGSLKISGEIDEAREHIRSCASCSNFVLDKSLFPILNTFFEKTIPEPSPSFFVNLSRKIEEADRKEEQGIFSELLMSASIKLVPAMAALLFCITSATAWFYESSPAYSKAYSMEEMVLFDEEDISSDTFLLEILKSEVKNAK